MSFFGKNIKKIRGVKSLSQQAFADIFDLKRGTLGAYEEGRSEPKIETIIKIANHFSIAIDELLTKELTVNQLLRFNDKLTVMPEELDKENFVGVPCITEKLAGDYLTYWNNEAFIADLPKLTLPVQKDKNFRAYTVNNLEMTTNDKGFFPKDVVVAEKIPDQVMKKVNNGTIVLVTCKTGLILRRLYVTSSGFVLRADHKSVDDINLPFNEVLEMWRVRYIFYRRLPDQSNTFEEKLALLEQQMQQFAQSK